ncbi:MAG: hypothetical protein AUI53_02095 [Acidobacteria bacterium 13_1_40CM_2_60_7]|nr:MAG: hypothetical protein AUI53_02095 [Acidobacteria bacterium 13_1_40CM_2_60_7]OLE87148.1 MAG: hypothetical protein AUG07_01485 [Acidobacteria bacterium 13_1_20CM_2_60_10]
MLAHAGKARSDGDTGDDGQADEVNDGDRSVGGTDVGVETQAGAKPGGAMLPEDLDHARDEQNHEEEEDTIIERASHGDNKISDEREKIGCDREEM